MLPADSVMRAAARWLVILRTSNLRQAWSLIRADTKYTDLTHTQYATAIEWLRSLEFVADLSDGAELSSEVRKLPFLLQSQLLFERSLQRAAPAWLQDSDVLIPDASELPQDAAKLAETLLVNENAALAAVRHIHGRIDLAQRARVGAAGERALVELLESRWPGSAVHVALTADGFGYDINFRHDNQEWHLEVKSTSRRGRLVIYLSRHEYEVSLLDPNWRLIIVGLNDQFQVRALATVRYPDLVSRTPRDLYADARWQSTSYQLMPKDLDAGLSFLEVPMCNPISFEDQLMHNGHTSSSGELAWMPHP